VFQVNFTSGRYFSGDAKEASAHLPFDVGFEVTNTPHAVLSKTHTHGLFDLLNSRAL
jgi:hypothetical protein